MNIEYLFLPSEVEGVLKKFPFLSKEVSLFYKEGDTSIAFPKARKSQREIYRILSNQHYPHLAELLHSIESIISNGYRNIEILKIRNPSGFLSGISEILIADSFIKRGFKVVGFDTTKRQNSVPDLLATSETFSFVAEIYKPRDWEGLDLFINDITFYLKNIDLPVNFSCKINMKLIHTITKFFEMLVFDPWSFSSEMENQKIRYKELHKITSTIGEKLKKVTSSNIQEVFEYRDFNLKVLISIEGIQETKEDYPSRIISYHKPTLSGYAPELMFDLLLRKKITKKLSKKQTHQSQGNHLRILVVDIKSLAYTDEFDHPIYLKMFKESLQEKFDISSIEVDMLVFCTPKLKGELVINLIVKKNHIENKIIKRMFGYVNSNLIIRVSSKKPNK